MATESVDVEVKQEQDLAAKLTETQTHVAHLALQISLLKEEIRTMISSRRGLPGGLGPIGPEGRPGRDAQIRIVQDGKTIKLLDGDRVAAEIVAVPGPTGATGAASTIPGPVGPQGKAGVSPSLSEIVAAVVKHFASRLS